MWGRIVKRVGRGIEIERWRTGIESRGIERITWWGAERIKGIEGIKRRTDAERRCCAKRRVKSMRMWEASVSGEWRARIWWLERRRTRW